ncbi:tyrosine-protein phosphatase non-receptor type 1-like [Ruditapes philippinarum]|uniref:tyrosine-protein phosphatase non-receptor type 1-like n=1 Tax=Ruditapes philippinarum TaxID=129788 RepID=UPI00295B655B|nr:tyrosine-protein phosphatase non-receptor type 1-like [Ruditapes philippinarum]
MSSEIEKEFAENEANHLWPQFYQIIKNEASMISINEKLSVGEARKPENRSKNRYRDVSPYDHSRVVLQRVPEGDSDYINASIIKVPESNRTYILSQGPLEHTAGQFWQMIWEQNTKAIIMLNRVIEKGTLKCHQYWPLGEDEDEEELTFDDTNLKVTLQEEQAYQHYTVRTFELENLETQEVREVFHFHYITWPDFGVPSSPVSFLIFLEAVRTKGVLEQNVGPAVIHCSAGIGRSGTFCLVDSALVLVENNGSLKGINVKDLLISMRSYRMGLIQTAEQLKFSYMAIIAGAKKVIALAGDREVNHVLDDYLDRGETPPTPPDRYESLPSNRRGPKPQPPPRKHNTDEVSQDEPAAKQSKLDSSVPQVPERANVEGKIINRDSDSARNDSRALPDDGRQHDIKKQDSENNNPKKDEDVVKGGDSRGGGQEGEGDEDSQDKQTGNSVSEPLSDTHLRQRRQEERHKRKERTQEMINKMKEKQKTSETWKKRRSIFKPIAIGLSLLVGTYILYRLYW